MMPPFPFRMLALLVAGAATTCAAADGDNSSSGLWSTQMIESVIGRRQGVVSSGAATSTLESGILALSIQAWLDLHPAHPSAADFSSYADQIISTVSPIFTNASSSALMPLDRLTVAQAIDNIQYDPVTRQSNQLTAAEAETLSTLNTSLALQRRNQYGGLWYYVYPNWSYLDGTVSFLPFMAEQSTSGGGGGGEADDALLQIRLLYANCLQNSTGLLVHGYDASKTAVWADKATGASPYVWGRSLGWYLAGLVNAWEILADADADAESGSGSGSGCGEVDEAVCAELSGAIREQFSSLATRLVKYADPATGVWYQLPTFPGRRGNFLESSSTALFIFSILKGIRLGLIQDDAARTDLENAVLRAYSYTTDKFVLDYGNGTLGWNNTVIVCSLNSTASYEYYTGRPIMLNAPLGEGAFVLASLEVERLGL